MSGWGPMLDSMEGLRLLLRQFWQAWQADSMTPELAARIVAEMDGGARVRDRLEEVVEMTLGQQLLKQAQEIESLREWEARARAAEEKLSRCEQRTLAMLELMAEAKMREAA